MVHPAQGRCLPHRTCKFCDASPENHNQHHEKCLANLPKHTDEDIVEWKLGRHDREQGLRVRKPDRVPYVMGWDFARLTASSEHAATSPERGIGVDLTL